MSERLSRRDFCKLGLAGIGSLFLVGCGIRDLNPTPTATRFNTPTNNPTLTSTPTPTLTPTSTPTPSATPSPTETPYIIDRYHLNPAQQEFLASHSIRSVDAQENKFAITCDDFPSSPSQLTTLLDALKGKAHATFFFIGQNLQWLIEGRYLNFGGSTDMIKRVADEGHEIGCHGFTHDDNITMTCLNDQQLDEQFEKWLEVITLMLPHYTPSFFRAPYGDFNERVLRTGARYGMQHAYWNISSGGQDVATLERVLSGAKPGGLLLTHMMRPYDVAYMGQMVDGLIQKGFHLETLSDALDPRDRLTF